jgi:hypothetical protein
MSGLSGANPYLARRLTGDLARQAEIAQENEARAERAKLDETALSELEGGAQGSEPGTPDTPGRRRKVLDRLRR